MYYIVAYVNDIVITRNDDAKIYQLEKHFFSHFQSNDLGCLKYFLGIKMVQSKEGTVTSKEGCRHFGGNKHD